MVATRKSKLAHKRQQKDDVQDFRNTNLIISGKEFTTRYEVFLVKGYYGYLGTCRKKIEERM